MQGCTVSIIVLIFGWLIQCASGLVCEEFFRFTYECERMDLQSLMAFAVLSFEVCMQSIEATESRAIRYRLSARFFLLIGIIQEALHESFASRTCAKCGRFNAVCNCIIHFYPVCNAAKVLTMQLVISPTLRRLRQFMRGSRFYNGQRPHSATCVYPYLYLPNYLKQELYMVYLRHSIIKWEIRYGEFLDEVWQYSNPFSEASQCLVYAWNGIFMRSMYFGETEVGLFGRFQSHLRCFFGLDLASVTKKRMAKLYVFMKKVGLRRMVMLPLHVWEGMVTKIQRLHLETVLIWWRQPRLNVSGTTHTNVRVEDDKFSLPKPKKPFRLVRRLVQLERKRAGQRVLNPTVQESYASLVYSMTGRAQLLRFVVRLARRPLKLGADFWERSLVKDVLWMSREKIVKVYKLITKALYGPSRNICLKNMGNIIKRRPDVHYAKFLMTSAFFTIPRTAMYMMHLFRSWQEVLLQQGIVVIIRIRMSPGASASIISLLTNLTKIGRQRAHEIKCCCDLFQGTGIPRVENHIFSPLSTVIEYFCGALPAGWNMLTRLVPNLSQLEFLVNEKLEFMRSTLSEKLIRKNRPCFVPELSMSSILLKSKFQAAWQRMTEGKHYQAFESNMESLQRILSNFAVGFIDKCRGEGFVACSVQYAHAIARSAVSMIPISLEQYHNLMGTLFREASHLPRFVYSAFQRADKHKFGTLRVWPKAKDLRVLPEAWHLIRWRPLIAFYAHHFKKSLTFLARFCSFVKWHFRLGFATMDGLVILQKLKAFNLRLRQFRTEMGAHGDNVWLRFDVKDIKEFFTSMSRLEVRDVVLYYVNELIRLNPTRPFFCVPKFRNPESIPEFTQNCTWRPRSHRLSRRCFLADRITRMEVGIRLQDIMEIVRIDTASDFVWVMGRLSRPQAGMSIGSPYSATGCSLAAAHREQLFLNALTDVELRTLHSRTFIVRWQDDILYAYFGIGDEQALCGILGRLQHRRFYGNRLELESVLSNVAFGYRVLIINQQLQLRGLLRYKPTSEDWVCASRVIQLNYGQGFCLPSLPEGEANGAMTRLLDTFYGPSNDLTEAVVKLACEMRIRGLSSTTMSRVLKRIRKASVATFPRDLAALAAAPLDRCRELVVVWDTKAQEQDAETIASQMNRWTAP